MLNESENQVASPPVDEGKTLLSLVEVLLGLSPVGVKKTTPYTDGPIKNEKRRKSLISGKNQRMNSFGNKDVSQL